MRHLTPRFRPDLWFPRMKAARKGGYRFPPLPWRPWRSPLLTMRRRKGRYIGTFLHHLRIAPRAMWSRVWNGGMSRRARRRGRVVKAKL